MDESPRRPSRRDHLSSAYAVAAGTGSRPLGGVFLAAGGLWCLREWHARHDTRTAVILGGVGLGAFIASHILALAIGAWPSVLLARGADRSAHLEHRRHAPTGRAGAPAAERVSA